MNRRTRKALRDFYFRDSSVQSFEKWLYTASALEKSFPDEYMDMISLDYSHTDDCLKAKKIIRKIYDTNDDELLFKHKALELVQGMLDSSITLEQGCRTLTKMYNEGIKFIPIDFVGFDSEFTDEDRRGMFDMFAAYSERIKEECAKLQNDLKQYAKDISG